jgi:hypothetical protein
MVDFLSKIPDHFRERFLDTHLEYLHNISYIIEKMYYEKPFDKTLVMHNRLMEQKPKLSERKEDS